jgi:hypothetical protein
VFAFKLFDRTSCRQFVVLCLAAVCVALVSICVLRNPSSSTSSAASASSAWFAALFLFLFSPLFALLIYATGASVSISLQTASPCCSLFGTLALAKDSWLVSGFHVCLWTVSSNEV